jgi:hypothetical protein
MRGMVSVWCCQTVDCWGGVGQDVFIMRTDARLGARQQEWGCATWREVTGWLVGCRKGGWLARIVAIGGDEVNEVPEVPTTSLRARPSGR